MMDGCVSLQDDLSCFLLGVLQQDIQQPSDLWQPYLGYFLANSI